MVFGFNFFGYLAIWRVSGPPLGAAGSPWAPRCPQEGSNERKAGSLDPPWAPSVASFLEHFCNISIKTASKQRVIIRSFWAPFWEPK